MAEKVLSLKAQRAQLEAKLAEWEENHLRTFGRPSTAQERQRSRDHQSISRLLVDVDAYIASLQGGGDGAPPPAQGTRDAQRRAERGRIKAKMRRWERDFEAMHNRNPSPADIEASEEMARWKSMLSTETNESGAADNENEHPSHGDSNLNVSHNNQTLEPANRTASAVPLTSANAAWSMASDYHELLRSSVESQAAINGFENMSAADIHAAAESFAAWDLDHDGVLSRDEFITVITSLAEGRANEEALDEDTSSRLFALVDRDRNGVIDFNEFLAVWKQIFSGGYR